MKKQQKNEKHRQMTIYNIKNEQQQNNLLEVLPSKYHHWEILTFDFKKQLQKVFINLAVI